MFWIPVVFAATETCEKGSLTAEQGSSWLPGNIVSNELLALTSSEACKGTHPGGMEGWDLSVALEHHSSAWHEVKATEYTCVQRHCSMRHHAGLVLVVHP